MIRQAKLNARWLPLLLVVLCSCNIFDFDTKNLEFGTWDDFPDFNIPPGPPSPYIDYYKVEPDSIFPGDSLAITCVLHDTLVASDYTFSWDLNQYYRLPEGVAINNTYKTIAPDSAGHYLISVFIHTDSTYSDTLDQRTPVITVYPD